MTPTYDPFAKFDLNHAIDLRWTLRDIRAKRWKFSSIDPAHLQELLDMGLVEMRDDEPALTNPGFDAIA